MQEQILNQKYKPAMMAGFFALTISMALIVIKSAAWFLTGSVILMASLVDSIGDFLVSLINIFAIRTAKRPADKNHRYGHGKIEGLASVFQGALIAGGGFFVLLEALQRLSNPLPTHDLHIAIIVMIASLLLTGILVLLQSRALKKSYSLATDAEKANYKGDIVVNLSILVVLLATYYGAPAWIDPLGALFVAVYLGLNAWSIAKKGVDMLLDKEVGGDTREIIMNVVLSHQAIHGMHDLRTRYNGNTLLMAFDVEMDPNLLLCEAHSIVKELEISLLDLFPHSEIMIHKDPIGETEDSRHQVKGVHK